MGIEGLELVETVNGVKLWKISASESEFFEDEVRLKGIDIVFFEKEEPILNLSAKEGLLDRKTKDIKVSSNVVVKTQAKTRITTTSLTWQANPKILFTTDRFTLTRDDTRIVGRGLVMDPKMERLEIKEQVGIVLR